MFAEDEKEERNVKCGRRMRNWTEDGRFIAGILQTAGIIHIPTWLFATADAFFFLLLEALNSAEYRRQERNVSIRFIFHNGNDQFRLWWSTTQGGGGTNLIRKLSHLITLPSSPPHAIHKKIIPRNLNFLFAKSFFPRPCLSVDVHARGGRRKEQEHEHARGIRRWQRWWWRWRKIWKSHIKIVSMSRAKSTSRTPQ